MFLLAISHKGVPMEFRVLGPVEIDVAGETIPLGRPQQRLVLAIREPNSSDSHRRRYCARRSGCGAASHWPACPGQWAARTRTAWQQGHLDAMVLWARSEVGSGDPAAVTGPLTELSAQHPLAEPLAVELMRAFHRLGRTAEALEAYGRIRQSLADELGIDPGHELHRP